jgi:hypothetical protein
LNKTGKVVLPISYSLASVASDGFLAFKQNKKNGLADYSGTIILEPNFDFISFAGKFLIVKRDGEWEVLSKKGAILLDFQPEYVEELGNDSLVSMSSKQGKFLMDVFTKERKSKYYDGLFSLYGTDPNNLFRIKLDRRMSLMDLSGNIVSDAFDEIGIFFEGVASVSTKGKYGFVDTKGKLTIPCIYDRPGRFKDGLCKTSLNGKVVFIDRKGKTVFSPKTDKIMYFQEGRAMVDGPKKGFLDKTGKVVIPQIYDYAQDFENGCSLVYKNQRAFYIDDSGKEIK